MKWVIVEDDRYCGSKSCRRITIRRGDEYITRYGYRAEVMAELRQLTGQARFSGGAAARRKSDAFWDQKVPPGRFPSILELLRR